MPVVVLIGMPGAGKSTLGAALAARRGLAFIDTDALIEQREKQSLQEIVDQRGYLQLREIEERILLSLDCHNAVVATGGSAVYSAKAMAHLAQLGTIVYLQVSLETLQQRIDNYESRGLARSPGQSLADLYAERSPLYARYATTIINCDGETIDALLGMLDPLIDAS